MTSLEINLTVKSVIKEQNKISVEFSTNLDASPDGKYKSFGGVEQLIKSLFTSLKDTDFKGLSLEYINDIWRHKTNTGLVWYFIAVLDYTGCMNRDQEIKVKLEK